MIERALSGIDETIEADRFSYAPKGEDENGKPYEARMFDLWPTTRDFLARLKDPENGYRTWSKYDQGLYTMCVQRANAAVMRDADAVFVTANNAGSEVVVQNFGDKQQFLATVDDEAAMIKEPDPRVGTVKLRHSNKVRVWWLVGDNSQLNPVVSSMIG